MIFQSISISKSISTSTEATGVTAGTTNDRKSDRSGESVCSRLVSHAPEASGGAPREGEEKKSTCSSERASDI